MIPFDCALTTGVDTQRTAFEVGRGLTASNLIRHRNGKIEKLAGCTRLTSLTFQGVARCLFGWQDLSGNHYLGIGTNSLLQVYTAGQMATISPIAHTSNLTTGFATTSSSATVTITDGGYTPAVGQWININTLTFVGGLLLQGLYQVQTVGSGTYTITAAGLATSNASGAGAVLNFATTNTQSAVHVTLGTYVFINSQTINVGVSTTVGGITFAGNYTVAVTAGPTYTIAGGSNASSSTSGYEDSNRTQIAYFAALPIEGLAGAGAYGAGAYGAGAYGTGSISSGSSNEGSEPNVLFTNEWSMDRWGQNLVFCWVTSTVYQWVPPVSAGNVGAAVSGAPSAVNGLFVAAPQQQTMAWGIYSASLGAQDPLLVGWCDVANLNQWTASTTNQAGSFRLSSGNLIIGGTWFGTAGLLWTDIELWSMSYIGFPLVYGFNQIGKNCGLIARRGWATLGSQVAWMSQQDFFLYQGGSVTPMTCTVRDFVFKTLDTTNLEAIHADGNTYGGEITWWFPQIGSGGVCTGAVKVHLATNEWDITSSGLTISAWCDQSVLGPPIGAFYTGLLQQFETAIDFDGAPLDSFIVSGFFALSDGEDFVNLKWFYPDFVLSPGGQISVTFFFADDMAAAMDPTQVRTYGPYAVTSATRYLWVNGRGRVMQIRVDCNTTRGTFWRYGKPPATIAWDGRR